MNVIIMQHFVVALFGGEGMAAQAYALAMHLLSHGFANLMLRIRLSNPLAEREAVCSAFGFAGTPTNPLAR